MKKSTLALSVAAVLGSFGFVGNAMAIGVLAGAANTTDVVKVNTDGIGHQLVVPYFTAQGANATLLNITNTDTVNGKVVKVRFRGAANSDDLFDFTLLLSPGDVWTAAVSQDPTTGLPLLKTTDASCALPASVKSASGQVFITGRVDPTPAKGSSINETREGYVEIITMADIRPVIVTQTSTNGGYTEAAYSTGTATTKAASLYGTVKHTAAVAACDGTVLGAKLGTDWATTALATDQGLSAPTGLLAADWVILNQTNTAAWSGSATALQVTTAAGVNAASNLIFWPQKDNAANGGASPLLAATATADPLFTSGAVTIQPFDLPDLSTPLLVPAIGVPETAAARADGTAALLAVKSVSNGFVTNSGIAGVTDFLFSQPTRRYAVAVNYAASGTTASAAGDVASTGTRAAAVYRGQTSAALPVVATAGSAYYGLGNTSLVARQVCLSSIPSPSFFDREESVAATSFVISPGVATAFSLCGEAAVASINAAGIVAGSALSATVVRNDVTFGAGYDLGWATFATNVGNTGFGAGASTALPILGSAFVRVANGTVNYGFTTAHKVTR